MIRLKFTRFGVEWRELVHRTLQQEGREETRQTNNMAPLPHSHNSFDFPFS